MIKTISTQATKLEHERIKLLEDENFKAKKLLEEQYSQLYIGYTNI